MNNILLLTFAVFFIGITTTDINAQCESLDYTEAFTTVSNDYRSYTVSYPGVIEAKTDTDDIHYFDGIDNPISYMGFTKGLWMGGLDPVNNLYLSAATYADGNRNDFYPGPFHYDIEGMGTCDIFNRVWVVRKTEIVNLKSSFEQHGQLDKSEIPKDILEWPAMGNPFFPDYTIENFMAPFHDENNDGIYNPLEGDLPVVYDDNVNFVPYLFGFRVFNNNGIHLESQGNPPFMEFHHTFYMTNCEELGPSNHSIFHRVKFISKHHLTLRDFKIGLFEDQDLGCYFNDYLGVDTLHKASYVYNEDGIDAGTFNCPSFPIPQQYSVIRSTKLLNRYVEKFVYFVNAGTGGPFQITDPQIPIDYYNYLSGLQRDGSPYTYGGNGIDPFGTPVEHVFTDYPNQVDGWSMQNNIPVNDYRSVTTFWEGELLPGQIVIAEFADHVYLDSINTGLSSFDEWSGVMEQLQQEYYQFRDEYDIDQCASSYQICMDECVWPGDVNNDYKVTYKDFVQLGTMIYNANSPGPARSVVSDHWFGFEADDWNESVGALNYKYGDCNGSGNINAIDLQAIENNYDRTTPSYPPQPLDNIFTPDEDITISFLEDSLDGSTGGSLFDKLLNLRVLLGEQGSSLTESIHGLGFIFQVDTSKFLSFGDEIEPSDAFSYSYNNANFSPSSFAGFLSVDDGRIDFAYTNLDNDALEEADELFRHRFILKENLTTPNQDGRDTFSFKINRVYALNEMNDTVYIGSVTANIPVYGLEYDPTTSIEDLSKVDEAVDLFPNPANSVLNIRSKSSKLFSASIFNSVGQDVQQFRLNGFETKELDINKLDAGIYILRLRNSDQEVFARRFVKH